LSKVTIRPSKGREWQKQPETVAVNLPTVNGDLLGVDKQQ
jgi:hypothetical protein